MKIGLSLSACVVDLLEGRVSLSDVFVIVSRTNFDPNNDNEWESLFAGYEWNGPWSCYADRKSEVRELVQQIERLGKLHQPRKFGNNSRRLPGNGSPWLELVPMSDQIDSNPALKQAWDRFNFIAGLSGDLD